MLYKEKEKAADLAALHDEYYFKGYWPLYVESS